MSVRFRPGLVAPVALTAVAAVGAGVLVSTSDTAAADRCPSFFVAPDGDDDARGTEGDPWRTIEHARDYITDRRLNTEHRMRCHITVNLRAGDYQVDESIAFGEDDSGANGHQIVYRSVDGPGEARLTGGAEVTGWEPFRDGIYKTTVDIEKPFHTLYVDGESATVARYPNRGTEDTWAPYLESVLIEPVKEAVRDQVGFNPGEWNENWDLGSYTSWPAQLTIWSGGSWSWFTDVVPIQNVDWADNKAILDHWTRYAMINSGGGSRYFIQNSLDFLDQAGEYYLDYEAGELYYKPHGGTMDGVEVVRPTVKTVLDVAGSGPEERVHDITFDGLAVAHTDFVQWYRYGWISSGDSGHVHEYPEYDRQIEMPRNRFGAVTMTNTRDITFDRMHFSDTGYHAIYMLFANENTVVENSLFANLGADGIKVEGGWPGEGDLSHGHSFRNLYIHHVGELVPGDAAGIELMNTGDNTVEHVDVRHSARYGISLESRPEVSNEDNYTTGNTFRYLHLENLGMDSGDTGAFYAYGVHNEDPWSPTVNEVSQIVIEDVNAHPSMPDGPPHGVHMDFGGCGFSFSDIEVSDVQGDDYHAGDTVCNEFDNVSWGDGFDSSRMEYDKIGVLPSFPYDTPPA